ncbi:MAG: CAP domain-containing protein [Deltaproteobacteria bacterium]|nr:CAP domain-containing protein [Deltaproteobacteria bacterium]
MPRPRTSCAALVALMGLTLLHTACAGTQRADAALEPAGRVTRGAPPQNPGEKCRPPSDLLPSERGVLEQTNALRSNPPAFAAHLEALRPRFEGNLMLLRPGEYLRTHEGVAAVDEAIAALKAQAPLPPLKLCHGLVLAARDHSRDSGPTGRVGHQGSDGSWPEARVRRYGKWIASTGENISYGWDDGRMVVMQLLIDDGVPSRGHRSNLLSPNFGVTGAGCGPHQGFRHICTIEYAGDFAD